MSEISLNGNLRKEAYQKLRVFMANPGRFCLLVLGSRGSGKHFAIEHIFKEIQKKKDKKLCLVDLGFKESKNIPLTEAKINQLFEENSNNTLVIENVEDLNDEQQMLLFDALSTENGKFGIGEKFDIRIIFTSSKDIDTLRSEKELLQGVFFDRISQLVVELPSYKKEKGWIINDFQATWKKMKFEKIKKYKHFANVPKNTKLEKLIDDKADMFDGGFRDLDKLVCLYFNYRIFHYGKTKKIDEKIENKIVDSVKEDFFTKSQLLGSSDNDFSVFQFEKGLSYKELESNFKIQLRKWAKKEYKTIGRAETALDMKHGTMKNYVPERVTQEKRETSKKTK
jgi:hypothetical protein